MPVRMNITLEDIMKAMPELDLRDPFCWYDPATNDKVNVDFMMAVYEEDKVNEDFMMAMYEAPHLALLMLLQASTKMIMVEKFFS